MMPCYPIVILLSKPLQSLLDPWRARRDCVQNARWLFFILDLKMLGSLKHPPRPYKPWFILDYSLVCSGVSGAVFTDYQYLVAWWLSDDSTRHRGVCLLLFFPWVMSDVVRGKARQDETRQDKARQDETRRDKTRQDEPCTPNSTWPRI